MNRSTNYKIGNTSIREDMDQVNIPYPTPQDFDQKEIFTTEFDYIRDRYICPTWVTATPDEMEETHDPDELNRFRPRFDVLYRLKPDVARANGLKVKWIPCSDARNVALPDETVLNFPKGSKLLQCQYDTETAVPRYSRPEGSL